jgi:hypothetical protein
MGTAAKQVDSFSCIVAGCSSCRRGMAAAAPSGLAGTGIEMNLSRPFQAVAPRIAQQASRSSASCLGQRRVLAACSKGSLAVVRWILSARGGRSCLAGRAPRRRAPPRTPLGPPLPSCNGPPRAPGLPRAPRGVGAAARPELWGGLQRPQGAGPVVRPSSSGPASGPACSTCGRRLPNERAACWRGQARARASPRRRSLASRARPMAALISVCCASCRTGRSADDPDGSIVLGVAENRISSDLVHVSGTCFRGALHLRPRAGCAARAQPGRPCWGRDTRAALPWQLQACGSQLTGLLSA